MQGNSTKSKTLVFALFLLLGFSSLGLANEQLTPTAVKQPMDSIQPVTETIQSVVAKPDLVKLDTVETRVQPINQLQQPVQNVHNIQQVQPVQQIKPMQPTQQVYQVQQAASRINVNQASAEQLSTLPGIGPFKAEAIIAAREQKGGFSSVADLQVVKGIGEKTIARLEHLVSF